MSRPAKCSRALIATLGAILGSGAVIAVQPASAFQAGTGRGGSGGAGGPLNLLSPTFIAPAPMTAVPRSGPADSGPNVQMVPAPSAMMTAPLPLPRPESAPRAVITAQNAPAPVAAGVVQQAQAQPAPAEAPQPPLLRPSMDEWPRDDDPSRVIIAGAYVRQQPAPATAAEAIAAAAPQQQSAPDIPVRAVAFAAPVPAARPGSGMTVMAAVSGTPAIAAPVLASASSTPVMLSTQGTATTTTMATPPAGSFPGAQQAVITTPTPARGPVLAALPPDGGARDWPRYVPGARGEDRNLGIAGERVTPDPGVPLSCLPAPVRRALNDVALRFGPVLVRSTHRGNGSFVRTDAWRGSYHRDCRAADFRVSGNPAAVLAFLRARHELGGVKRYRNGLFHIDNGPRRSW